MNPTGKPSPSAPEVNFSLSPNPSETECSIPKQEDIISSRAQEAVAAQKRFDEMVNPIAMGCLTCVLVLLLAVIPMSMWEHDLYPAIHSKYRVLGFLLFPTDTDAYLLYPSPFILFGGLIAYGVYRVTIYVMRENGIEMQTGNNEQKQPWTVALWATAACVFFLLLAIGAGQEIIGEFPYGYYTFLRLCVTALCAYYCYLAAESDKHPILTLLAAGIAILYQPIIKISLEQETWCWVNLMTIPVLVVFAIKLGRADNPPNGEG